MSVYGFDRGRLVTVAKKLPAGSTDILVPASITPSPRPLVVAEVLICNSSGGAVTITLNRYDGTTDFPLLGAKSIAANDSYNLTFPFDLLSTWKLRATPGTADVLTVTVTYVDTLNA